MSLTSTREMQRGRVGGEGIFQNPTKSTKRNFKGRGKEKLEGG